MKKKLKVLHVASFTGNIGDNANHRGTAYLRDCFLDYEFDITRKEIREFYWKEWCFNSDEFITESNQHDLVMIGGGNYFELWIKDSTNGTSVDISIETLNKINTPILFYSLGCDLGKDVPENNIVKFRDFLDYVTSKEQYLISVRNDGAMENIVQLYGQRYDQRILEIPDGGFFTSVKDIDHYEIEKDKLNIIINIAGDMNEVRFPGGPGKISYDIFKKELADLIEELSEEYQDNLNVVFIPHIFKDIETIYDVLNEINDKVRRKCIKLAPYLTGDKGHDYNFSLYSQADLVLGMRFHSIVCSMALSKDVIGLVNYVQIKNLYKGIGLEEYVSVNEGGFRSKLKTMIVEHLCNKEKYIEMNRKVVEQLKHKAEAGYSQINKWLKTNLGRNEDE